ncbi:MAG: sensor histidine kinase [Xenococcaceae cyanobacterium]
MASIDFALGVVVGLSIYIWKKYQFKYQLRSLLKSFSPEGDWASSLKPISLVRRELTSNYERIEKLEQQLQIWQELIEQAPVGFLRIDRDNRLLWCNQKARELLKIDRWQSGQVRLLLELVRSYELDRLIEQTRKSQQKQVQEWTFYYTQYVDNLQTSPSAKISQKIESLAVKGYGIPLPQGKIGIFLLDRQAIVELSSYREEAFSNLTHELRTPLTSIALVAENLLGRLDNPERRWVEKMLQETNRLISLVHDWLDLTQLQADPQQSLQYSLVELPQLIFSVWHTLKPIAERKEVTLVYSGSDRLEIEADRSRLNQVLLNLLDNSIKHSSVGGEILVAVELVTQNNPELSATSTVEINIIDSGNGFATADLPHIFERLYRGDKSRTRQGYARELPFASGSGLGLAIVKQIIEAHGGVIEANNHPQTKGAWLKIILPRQSS